MVEPVAAAALLIEVAIGWPSRLHAVIGHPVGLFARLILFCERHLNDRNAPAIRRRIAGALASAVLIATAGGGALLAEQGVRAIAEAWLGGVAWPLIALLAWPAIAARSLDDHVRPILRALAGCDLPLARNRVGMIVGRDTGDLDEPGVSRAAIESLAESFCDGVVAPVLWLLLLGLPGVWMLKAINTADSLIGHREEPFGPYGWASARIDDAAMLLPARLSAVLLCAAGGGGWRLMMRDHGHHASPNAGWPEAAMAGCLGVALAGPVAYDGALADKPWIGKEGAVAGPVDLGRALRIYRRACILLGIIALVTAVATGGGTA